MFIYNFDGYDILCLNIPDLTTSNDLISSAEL